MEPGGAGDGRGPAETGISATLLAALEALRAELGETAEELIALLRAAGITPVAVPSQAARDDGEAG
ncbi:MAG: hypothetical protein WHV61_06085 [Burkholderiales bacterium]